MMSYTHILMGNSSNLQYYKSSHDIVDTINGFDGVSFNRHKFPFLEFKTKPKIWILTKK